MSTETVEKRALVLSGGGGRGAYHIGALAYLEDVGWRPDIIVGTSIGAVNGAALGSGLPVTALRDRWLELETGHVQKMQAADVYLDNLVRGGRHVFDTTPLLGTLKGTLAPWLGRPWVIPEVLNGAESPYDVWITAVDADLRQLVYFNNRGGGISAESVQASCSIPLWYEPTVIKGTTYLDGGTLVNTPFRKALELGATEIVVVMMAPWPGRPVRTWHAPQLPSLNDELLAIPQRLWAAFEPALDMMLGEIAWKDYELLRVEQRLGAYPHLKWIRFVSPDSPLPVGLMTTYARDNHIRLFRRAEKDAHQCLDDIFGEPVKPRPFPRKNLRPR